MVRLRKNQFEYPKVEHNPNSGARTQWTLDPALVQWQQNLEIISLLREMRDLLRKR